MIRNNDALSVGNTSREKFSPSLTRRSSHTMVGTAKKDGVPHLSRYAHDKGELAQMRCVWRGAKVVESPQSYQFQCPRSLGITPIYEWELQVIRFQMLLEWFKTHTVPAHMARHKMTLQIIAFWTFYVPPCPGVLVTCAAPTRCTLEP